MYMNKMTYISSQCTARITMVVDKVVDELVMNDLLA